MEGWDTVVECREVVVVCCKLALEAYSGVRDKSREVNNIRRVLQNGHGLFMGDLLQAVVVHLSRHRNSRCLFNPEL
ncbi:hypothetical protein EYF80_009615 [Liparis tanakae]|uniref:Uncharacterized protein n=1 Tax=Liparis tanakae TaxID=230148 RepID=A0A4Z2IRF3_9TELE|nr:hypothetical protein EYF80_009615 [Liparis tanakae]